MSNTTTTIIQEQIEHLHIELFALCFISMALLILTIIIIINNDDKLNRVYKNSVKYTDEKFELLRQQYDDDDDDDAEGA
jgi:hypothetical protein